MGKTILDFLERVRDRIENMSPEEVLALHQEAQETIEEPISIELPREDNDESAK